MTTIDIHVQTTDFDITQLYARLREGSPAIGAITSFVGLMRDFNQDDTVTSMYLEHYPGMTEKVLQKICRQAGDDWNLEHITLVHRVGDLFPSDQIVFVGVSSTHRGDAFDACAFIMDFLKTQAPFWKRENTPRGHRWVAPRASDTDAAQRWQKP